MITAPTNGFFGRSKELSRIGGLLQEARLVTIAGPGGCGKTRLAQEAARTHHGERFLADLSVCVSEDDVVRTVAGIFAIHETKERPLLDHLIETLRQRSALLVLDNCEQVVGGVAAFVRALIGGTEEIRFLATSREPIDVTQERVIRLKPLDIDSAVELFADRAAEYGSFALETSNAPMVRDICQRLDALPFAIELAASALRMMSLDALAQALDERLVLPSFRLEPTSKRRRNLRSLIEWSVSPLSMDERLVLRRLAVFAGGFSNESARTMFAQERSIDVDVILNRLVATSLVTKEKSGGAVRYRMLETTREYLLAMLDQVRETDVARRDHSLAIQALAMESRSSYARTDTLEWIARSALDEANVRAALDWSLARLNDPSTGAWIVVHWTLYAAAVGNAIEHRRWIEKAFAATQADGVLAAELHAAAATSAFGGAAAEIADHARAAFEFYATRDDRLSAARAQRLYGARIVATGEFDRGEQLLLAATQTLEREGNAFDIAQAYYSCAEMHGYRQQEKESLKYAERALEIARRSGFHALVAASLSIISYYAFARGEFEQCVALSRESRTILKKQGSHNLWTMASLTIGECEYRLGNIRAAAAEFAEALQWSNILGDRWLLATTLERISGIAALLGRFEDGARLLGGGAELMQSIGMRQPLPEAAFVTLRDALRERLGPSAFDRIFTEGRDLSITALSALAGETASHAFVMPDASVR